MPTYVSVQFIQGQGNAIGVSNVSEQHSKVDIHPAIGGAVVSQQHSQIDLRGAIGVRAMTKIAQGSIAPPRRGQVWPRANGKS